MRPKFREVFGEVSIPQFYARGFTSERKKTDKLRILSLGSGLCIVEQNVALELRKQGYTNFHIECLEMSPERCSAATQRFSEQGLSDLISVREQDLSQWKPEKGLYTSVMANHSLHHFVALEQIFKGIERGLDSQGLFVINDIIGRNGHQRWPEVLVHLRSIWKSIPIKYKFNYVSDCVDEVYENKDYSRKNFEGIRAQDILPMLNEHFRATHFVAEGGLPDDFIDRIYGHNFDPDSPEDCKLIDQIGFLNSMLIDAGTIKPTMILAWFCKKDSERPETEVHYKHWSSKFCERVPSASPETGLLDSTALVLAEEIELKSN